MYHNIYPDPELEEDSENNNEEINEFYPFSSLEEMMEALKHPR